jgi:hypothetical protein
MIPFDISSFDDCLSQDFAHAVFKLRAGLPHLLLLPVLMAKPYSMLQMSSTADQPRRYAHANIPFHTIAILILINLAIPLPPLSHNPLKVYPIPHTLPLQSPSTTSSP